MSLVAVAAFVIVPVNEAETLAKTLTGSLDEAGTPNFDLPRPPELMNKQTPTSACSRCPPRRSPEREQFLLRREPRYGPVTTVVTLPLTVLVSVTGCVV